MLRQWFFSKVVLTSLTNGSQCTFAVSNFLKFTFPLYFSIIFSVFKSYCFIMKIFKKICSCSSFLISASFQYLHFQYLRFQFFHSDFDVLGEPWKHRQIRQSFYSFSLILLMRCSVWSTSMFLFSNSTIFKRCISKSSKHSSGTFGLCESDFNPLKRYLHGSFFVFLGKYFIGISSNLSDILLNNM